MTSDTEGGPRQRAAETKRKRTREQIITATIELYEDAEAEDFTRDQIAEAAGVGVATLHNHFSSKYGVLRAAYERLLSPVVQPIVRAQEVGIYNPPDRVFALCLYVSGVCELSWSYRSLTVAMVRSYFDASFGPDDQPQHEDDENRENRLTWPIIEGMLPITSKAPFELRGDEQLFGATGADWYTIEHHSYGLLMHICHRPKYGSARGVAIDFLAHLLAAILPTYERHALLNLFALDELARAVPAYGTLDDGDSAGTPEQAS